MFAAFLTFLWSYILQRGKLFLGCKMKQQKSKSERRRYKSSRSKETGRDTAKQSKIKRGKQDGKRVDGEREKLS